MQRVILFFLTIHLLNNSIAQQNVAINSTGALPHASAQLDISSTNKGILIPRMSSMQRVTIASPATGLIVFDTDTNGFWFYNGISWTNFASTLTNWGLNGNTGTNPSIHFIGTTENTDLRFKINNINSGLLNNNGNVFWGLRSGDNTTSGLRNIAIGKDALRFNTTQNDLIAIGDSALFYTNPSNPSTNGYSNTAVGSKSLLSNLTGSANTAMGYHTMENGTGGTTNTAFGFYAMHNNNGDNNNAFGANALQSNTMGISNVAIGTEALPNNSSGSYNVSVGYQSMYSNQTGLFNTAMGTWSLLSNTTGHSNVAIGVGALKTNTTQSKLVAVGDSALFSNSGGFSNTAIGSKALFSNSGGISNTATGINSLFWNFDGYNNTANGAQSLNFNMGNHNTGIGADALSQNISGSFNTAVGSNSLNMFGPGNYNSTFGYNANVYTTLTNATAIGASARVDCSNCMVLGSINGVNSATSNVNVGIGTTTPQQMLSVGAAMNVDQSNTNNGTANPGLIFGSLSGEAIASKRTAGGNQYGLDFYTNSINQMSISNSGTVSIGTTTAGSKLLVSGSESTLNGGNAAIQITNTAPGSNNTWYFRAGATGTVTPAGALSIADNGAYRFILSNDGNAWLQGTLTQNSDARLKKNVQQLSSSLNHLQQLNGYSYNWKDPSMDTTMQLGLIAQEVKQIFPGLVKQNMNGELSLNYIGLIPVMIESIKEQQQQIEQLKKENAEIRELLNKIK